MKPSLFVFLFIYSLSLCSCKENHKQQENTNETPVALQQEKSGTFSLKKGRSNSDLVESLYSELATKSPELQELESQIESFANKKDDSLSSFNEFSSKNTDYYLSAGSHADRIKDSVLKKRIKSVIDKSHAQYANITSIITSLISQIESGEATLNDLHTVLKLVRTLPLIEKYQKDKLPSSEPAQSLLHELEKIIRLADSLTKK